MSPAHLRPFKILWITLQMILPLIGPYPASPHLHPYISEFRYVPQYHPSRNPDCTSRWFQHEFYNDRFDEDDRRSSFKEPLVNHPWIEIRAVLVHCSQTWKEIRKTSHTQSIKNCRRKVIISIKINNVGKTNTREEFMLVDHVLDPVKMRKVRLRNPYVIKIRQESLLHLYGLKFQGVVNAEAKEEVINNHRANFTGCNDGLDNPTCGQILVNEEPIPFSQGFCCSCEDAQRAESFRSIAAKSNYYQRDDGANRARNRSVSSANLFDNLEAQRQVETRSRNEEHNRQVENNDALGRVTSRNTSAVNGPLGEQASPLRKQQEKEQLKNNSVRQSTRPLEGFPRENANRAETLPSVLTNVFSNPSPSKGKIEAYIDAVYEQAMKERAMKQAIKHESDKDLLDKNDLSAGSLGDLKDRFRKLDQQTLDRQTSDGQSSLYGSVTDNFQNTITTFTNIVDRGSNKLKSPQFSSQFLDHQSDSRALIQGSAVDDPSAKLTRLEGEQAFVKMGSKEDNREFLKLEKCDRSVNFSESGIHEEMARDRFRGAAHPENTFDYTPTSLAIHSSRIPEESQFSRRTSEKNAFSNGDNTLLDNGSISATTEFFIRPGISLKNDENINYGIALSTIESNSFEENIFALLSKIMISETRSSTEGEERQCEFRASENISDNVNALRNASIVRKNLSAAAIRRGNASSKERKTENANVSMRISTAPAFTRLQNLSSSNKISRLEELSVSTVAARSADKSLTKILESETRGSLPANEIQRFPFENLYKDRESYKMYNSPERAPKDVNLKNSYKFWKTRRKLRKGAEKFHGEKLKRFGKSDRGLMRKHALPDFKRDSLWNKFSKRDRRFRRHLQTGKKVFNIVDAHNRSNSLTDKASRYKTQGFIDYTRPETYSKQIPNTGGSKSPKKQMIFKSGHSHRKVQFEANDNPFYFNNKDGEKDSVDKRIEDKFMRISNVLKEDSTKEEDSTKIIQETPKNFKVVRKSEIAKADIPKIQDELEHNSLSRGNGRSDKPFMIHSDKPAELIDKYQGSTVNENSFTESTITSNEVTITSLIKQKDSTDYKGSVFLKLVIGPFLPSSITRKFNVSREVNFNESKNPIYATEFATRQTEVFTQKLLSDTSWNKNVNDYFEVTGDPLRTLSSSWENSSTETMSPEALNTRSEGERVETNNVRFFELNNNPPRIIAGNSMKPEGSPIDPMLSSRDSASVTEPEEISLSRKETDFYYTKEPLLENSESFLERSREKEEIAKLVDRIVRQYAVYTPIMPSMRTFDEITEAKTLPLEEETTVAQFTTTLVTTTKITDVAFRPSIRPLRTIPFLEEIHVEISLDETTFMEETEATTITHEMTVPKPKFQPGRPSVSTSFKTKTRRPSNKTEKNGKRRQEITNYVTSLKMMDAEKEEHPWYRTTEMQQIIAANRSEPIQKIKGGRKHRYKSVDYFQNTSSGWTSSTTVSSDVAQTRGKRSDFNRAAGNRDSLIFYDYDSEDEEAHRNGRTGLNKNGKSPNITELTELRSRIEKRLAGELDYPASRGFSRRSCENQDETQKLNAALQDIVGRNVRFRTVQDNLDSHVQEKKRDKRDNLKNFTVIKLKNDTVRKLDKDIYSRNCEITSASLGTSPAGPTKIPPLRTDLSGSVREKLEMDRRSEKAFGEGMEAEIDRIAVVRKIAVNVSENARTSRVSANDLSDRGAEPQEKSSAGGILPTCVRSLGYQDKSIRETDTVIRGVKLMIPNDKGESRELDVAAKSVDKKISPLFSNGLARQRGHEDTRKINENLADSRVSRVSAGKQYLRRPRRKVHDIVRKIINKIKGKSSSVSDKANTEKSLVESEKRAGRLDWHRSGRRLLSNRGSDYIENIDDVNDEYYANDESETDRENDSSDNEAIARRDDLLYLENPPDRGENRDPRKLVAKTDRLAYRNADVTRPMMQEERTVAAYDVAMLSNDMQANSEEAISSNYRNNKKKVENKNTKKSRDIKVVPESSDPANFNDDQMLEVPLEAEEKSIIQRTTNNNNSVQEKSFDNSKNILRNSRSYEEINEEPFSFPKNINKNYLRDESFYGTQPIFNTREIINSPTVNNHNLSNAGKISNDLLQDSAVSQNEGIKISLIGKIQIHGGFNQTPMLISFDAIPDGFSATQASVSTGLSDTIRAIETTVINLLNDSNVESQTFDLLSISESANDEASDSLNTITDESQEVGKTNVNQVPIKSPEKFFDLMERSKDEGKLAKKNPSRVEKRLDKHNANSRSPKQVFLTNYYKSNGKVDRTNGRVISGRTGGATDKLDSRSSANPVYFPDILGSVLVNNDSLKDQDSKEPRHRIDVPTIETNRSNPTDPNVTPHVVPLVHIGIEKPNVDLANDGKTKTVCCPCSDLWNASFGGCYKMPATVRKLEITETISRELQTSSNYRDDDHTETFPPKLYETTVNDQNAVTMKSSPSTQLQNGILEAAVKCTNETCSTMTPSESNKCDNKSINAIRVRNMMAIVRFMLKLLRVITEDEEPPCPIQTQIGETVIHVKNIINAPSYVERQKSATDRTVMKSGRTRQDLLTTEWRSTITERIREESSPLGDSTFESFTEAPSHPAASTLPTSSDKMFKDEELFTLFETSTRKEVYTSTLSSTISSVTFKPFLFYELGRKSLRKDASRKNTKVDLTGVKQNSNVSFKGSKDELEGNKSRLDGSQTNRSSSWPRDQIRSSVDRLHFGKQGVASVTNSEDKIQSFQKKYLARSKNTGFRRSESTGTANDTVRLTLPRDIDVSRNTLLDRIGAMRENRLEYSKSKRTRQAGISDRCAETRMKLLNRSMREGPPRDWIGEHRAATRRLSIDKKLRESRKVPGGTATPGKVVFRRVRGKINRPPDPNLVSGRSDSFKIEGNVVGNGPLAKLSTNDALSTVDGGLSSLKREDTFIRYSTTSSLTNDNIGIFRTDEEIIHKHISVPNKKRDVSERHDFWEGNHVLRNRQEASSPTRRKTKQRRKKKRKKGSQRTKVISETENQRRFRRHLLMMSLKPEYDADDATARFSRRYVATEKRNAENFRKSAGSNVRRRRGRDGSRTVDGSEADPSTAQIRGGQDCTDRRHPPNIDAAKYLESAHCLRFSDLWYSVYQLEDPIVDHAVYLQVYEKRVLANGSTYWKDLTGDSVVRLGTFNRHHRDSQDTIAFAYKEVKMLGREKDEIPNLDVVRDRLLVPSSVTSKGSEYPAEGESGEYLVIPASSINESGNECDKAGVGFAAFARQPDRCERVRGTCLKNQPLAYRRRDAEARAAGRPGCYFLSNFASVPSEPIKYSANGSGSHEFLALEYHSPHVSAIDIEIEASYNAALMEGPLGRISQVHVDSRALNHTVVTVVITNTGLTSMFYQSRIAKCSNNLPESWVNATFPRKLIQPRRDQSISLDLYGELPINEFHCSVQLLNRLGGLVATRRIKVRKMDHCSCVLHCLCVCVGDARGTGCKPMSPELYHAAGFRGPVPAASHKIFVVTVDILFFIVLSILLLLFMGFLKWSIGLYIPVVGRWGLDSLLETSGMSEYFERELKYKCMVMDEHGAPVHPDTRKRTVRICSRKAEFFLNAMFFFIFPFAICCIRLKKPFRRPAHRHCCSDGSKEISLMSDRSERPRMICVNTYGDSQDSRMEIDDTKYVIDELKKSEESLRSRIRSKRNSSTKEYRSRH